MFPRSSAKLLHRVMQGEEVLLTDGEHPVAKLVPVASGLANRPCFGSAKGLITISDDFDEPLEDFEPYMQ